MTALDGARSRVLTVLQESLQPLPNIEVSRLAGLPLQQAKNRLAGLIKDGMVLNVGTRSAGLYALAEPRSMVVIRTQEREANDPYSRTPTGTYSPGPGLPGRPGQDDFLAHPHLINGERVERVRPRIISAKPEQRAVFQ